MSKRKYWLWSVVLLLLCYLCSTKIAVFALSMTSNRPMKLVDIDSLVTNETGYSYLNPWEYLGGLGEIVQVNGWAFCENPNSTGSQKTYLVFKGDKYSYISTPGFQRISDIQLLWGSPNEVKQSNYNVGFGISTLSVKSGTYEMLLYIVDGNRKSLVNTGRSFQKNGQTASQGRQGRQVQDLAHIKDYKRGVKSWYNILDVDDQYASINGWIFMPEKENLNSLIYIQSASNNKTNSWLLPNMFSPSLMDEFGNGRGDLRYVFNRFEARIPIEEFGSEGQLRIVLKHDDVYYSNEWNDYNLLQHEDLMSE